MTTQYSAQNDGNTHETASPQETASTAQPQGCNLKDYADYKRLPIRFLKELGLSNTSYSGNPAVRIPYKDQDGTEVATRYRKALAKDDENDNRFACENAGAIIPH